MAKKKATSQDERAVYDYLKKTNRPYSATDIFNNLHSKYPKSMVTKSLERLVEDDMVISKTYGKTMIYVVTQPKETEEEEKNAKRAGAEQDNNNNTDKTMEEFTEKHNALKDENRKLDSTAQKLKSQLITEEAKSQLVELRQEHELLEKGLKEIKESGGVIIKKEDRLAVENQYNQYMKLWKKRKAIFREIHNQIREHVNISLEDLGIEEDPPSNS